MGEVNASLCRQAEPGGEGGGLIAQAPGLWYHRPGACDITSAGVVMSQGTLAIVTSVTCKGGGPVDH